MIDLYVYYKVGEADAAALAPRVLAMQAALAAGLPGGAQLKRRPGASAGLQTWMEVYPDVADEFLSHLDAAVEEAGLAVFLAGPRRAEVFMDLSLPCA